MFRAPLARFLCAAALAAGLLATAVAAGKSAGAATPYTGNAGGPTSSNAEAIDAGSALTFFPAVVTSSGNE